MPWSQGGGAIGDILLPSGAPPPLVCAYTPPSNPSTPSSNDVWGASVGPSGLTYNPASPPPSPVQTISGGPSLYGVANNGSGFGISSGVGGPWTIEARWAFDMAQAPGGSPSVCRAGIIGAGSIDCRLAWSDNGIAWTDLAVLPTGNGPPIVVANLRHRYWSIHFGPVVLGFGFFSGVDMSGFLLWGAS